LGDYLREEDKAMDGGLHLTLEQRKQVTAEQDEVIRKMWAGMCGFSQFFDEKSLVNQLNWTSTPAAMSACNPLLSIFSPSVRQQYTGIDILSIVHNNIDEFINTKMQNQWHPLHSAMYTWGKGWLANQLLSCLGDRVEMAHSIEARTPFLDHKLTEYINGLPPSMKMRYSPVDGHGTDNLSKADFIEKYALREATKDFITPEIYTRRKQPYIAPTSYPPNGPMHKLLVKIIVKENVENLGFLDWQVVQPMLDRAFDGEKRTIEFRHCLCIAEWIVLSKRFKVARAD
jgi:asparagine synthase (glutamine-hydrolysing)